MNSPAVLPFSLKDAPALIERLLPVQKLSAEVFKERQQARDVFEMRYQKTIDPDKDRWELCSRVLARRDVVDRLSIPW